MGYREIDVPGEWADEALCLKLPAEPAPTFEFKRTRVNFDGTPASPQEPTKRDFFPPTSELGVPTGKASREARTTGYARALRVCHECPVRPECFRWAFKNHLDADHDGILGGETPTQRRNRRLGNRTIRNEHAA